MIFSLSAIAINILKYYEFFQNLVSVLRWFDEEMTLQIGFQPLFFENFAHLACQENKENVQLLL